MAAKKLNFIRSCSRSCKVRSEAESSSWRWSSSATERISMRLTRSPVLAAISPGSLADTSVRHSSSRGLKAPHWPSRIISTALSWGMAGLYTRGLVRASYTSARATIWAEMGISSPFRPSG